MNSENSENSEKTQLSQLSQLSEDILDDYLTALYKKLKFRGDSLDKYFSNLPKRVKAGDIIEMNQIQKEKFYGIVKDSYNALIKMPEVENVNNKFEFKIHNSDTLKNYNFKLTPLELINHILFTVFLYIYKLENISVEYGFSRNDFQKYEFAKIYTLILDIPGMAKRITDLASDINSNGQNVILEPYTESLANPRERVIPPTPRQGWRDDSKKGGVKSTFQKSRAKRSSFQKSRAKRCTFQKSRAKRLAFQKSRAK